MIHSTVHFHPRPGFRFYPDSMVMCMAHAAVQYDTFFQQIMLDWLIMYCLLLYLLLLSSTVQYLKYKLQICPVLQDGTVVQYTCIIVLLYSTVNALEFFNSSYLEKEAVCPNSFRIQSKLEHKLFTMKVHVWQLVGSLHERKFTIIGTKS